MITFDEVSDLGLYWSFLQVLNHHVGNSGQMTHVASPGAALNPEITGSLKISFNTVTATSQFHFCQFYFEKYNTKYGKGNILTFLAPTCKISM